MLTICFFAMLRFGLISVQVIVILFGKITLPILSSRGSFEKSCFPKAFRDALMSLSDNRYSEDIISRYISSKISLFSKPKVFGPNICTVYLRSPFVGLSSLSLQSNVKTAVENCCNLVVTRVVRDAKPMLSPATKDLLPALHKSSVIYEYKCHCDSRYVG